MTPPDPRSFWSPARTFWAGLLIATTSLVGWAYTDYWARKGRT